MKASPRSMLRSVARTLRRWNARRAAARLSAHEVPRLNAVGQALHETLDDAMSPDESGVISRIEARRSLLLQSNETIPVTDYGAGSSDSRRTHDEMRRGVQSTASVARICMASKPAFWALFLFKLIRKLRPASCLELGSCVGVSAAYQAAALHVNGQGRLLTLEGSPAIADIARSTLAGLELSNASVVVGPFHETYRDALETARPVDFLFNDGHHDHDALLSYFSEALPYLADEAVIVFDDISWSPGMRKAWKTIERDQRVAATIDMRTMGIALVGGTRVAGGRFSIPL